MKLIAKREKLQAQIALLVAIALQIVVWRVNHSVFPGLQPVIIITELAMAVLLGITTTLRTVHARSLQRNLATGLLGLISLANLISLALILNALIFTKTSITGIELLTSAIAIFATNIIVFALWYWELDSPGLTSRKWSKHDKDFHFVQQDLREEFPDWEPEFLDYLYISVTNGINFSSSDPKPLTRGVKLLLGTQALISAFMFWLIVSRSVSILGS
jgi:uncharacterized membrane protein